MLFVLTDRCCRLLTAALPILLICGLSDVFLWCVTWHRPGLWLVDWLMIDSVNILFSVTSDLQHCRRLTLDWQ